MTLPLPLPRPPARRHGGRRGPTPGSGSKPSHRVPRVACTAIVLAVLCLAGTLVTPGTAGAQPGPTTTTTSASPRSTTTGPPPAISDRPGPEGNLTIVDPRLSPELANVSVEAPAYLAAVGIYRGTQKRLATATATYEGAVRQIAELTDAQIRLTATIITSARRRDKSQARLDVLHETLAEIAVSDYVRGNTASLEDIGLDPAASTDRQGDHVVVRSVRRQQLAEVRAHRAVVNEMTAVLLDAQDELDEVVVRLGTETATRDRGQADQQRESARLIEDGRAIADARLTSDVRGQDYSLVALDAYVRAARTMAVFEPECRIGWSLLAGISRTEGWHGTYGGSRLDAGGNETKPILGIALDGSNGTAVVGDTDGGVYDGDASTDRAVGPMQFIPSTWKRWGRDGNADGTIDPQNMYDAALAAAAYLCYFGPGLDTDDGIRGAVIHYNRDAAYVELVLTRAKGYAAFTFE